jgi:diguanylate cyclase (GGDEF)-like protein
MPGSPGRAHEGVLHRVVRTLTMPLPGYIADCRESARTVLVFAALGLALSTLWLPQPVAFRRGPVLVLAGFVAATGVVSMLPRFHAWLNRLGGLLLLGQIAALVALTGGAQSIYTPLYVLLLLYAAVFYGPARLLATAVVVLIVLAAPLAYSDGAPQLASTLWLKAGVWGTATAAVHWLVARMRTSAQTDGLTGLWNHVTFWQLLRTTHEQHRRTGEGYSVLLLDIDHFKQVNDTRGHRTGDEVLRSVAALIEGRCRRSDIVARYGGEEFAIVLPNTGREDAVALGKELRLRVLGGTLPVPVTVSVGVAASTDGFATSDQVVAAADSALYEAKAAGRNHVAVATATQLPRSRPVAAR